MGVGQEFLPVSVVVIVEPGTADKARLNVSPQKATAAQLLPEDFVLRADVRDYSGFDLGASFESQLASPGFASGIPNAKSMDVDLGWMIGCTLGGVDTLDIRNRLILTPKQNCSGSPYSFSYNIRKHCGNCSGVGDEWRGRYEVCARCHGAGNLCVQKKGSFGIERNSVKCSTCGGGGLILKTPCTVCGGKRYIEEQEQHDGVLPAGSAGKIVRFPGKGHYADQITRGALVLEVVQGVPTQG